MTLLRFAPILVALVAALSSGYTAETDQETAQEAAASPEAPLIEAFGEAPLVEAGNDGLRWGDDQINFTITARGTDGDPLVTTAVGPIRVDTALIESDDRSALDALPDLIAHAEAAGIASEASKPLYYSNSPLTGLRLRGKTRLVLAEGVMALDKTGDDDGGELRARVSEAAAAMATALADSGLDAPAQRTVAHVLERATVRGGDFELDEITPSFARRVIGHGWLIGLFPKSDEAAAMTEAVRAARRLHADLAFTGEAMTLRRLVDAYGDEGWLLRTPQRSVQAMTPPQPMALHRTGRVFNEMLVVVRMPPEADPVTDPGAIDRAESITLFHKGTRLARWTETDGLQADLDEWRLRIPAEPYRNAVAGVIPPHIVLTGLRGDVHALITAHGVLTPPQNASRVEAERFLDRAATILPDAPHLDLIGQYLFKYTYDSPDSRYPFLLGNKNVKGDIHQTVYQSLATVAGGVCRGDCDDLSELYQDILERQGKTAHVISLPSHAAASWAEQRDDAWHVYLLQTGPAYEFADEKLQVALEQTYRHFDATDTFDPNGLGLLLRFSGENTRSSWRLSYRIFSEPDYAETMIDIQRDWHFQTYLQGIKKMERLIASGDEDTANYSEMAGLFNFTGQYEKAAEYLRMAIDRTPEPESKLFKSTELVAHLLEADKTDEAHQVVEDVLTEQLPPLREELGPRLLQFGIQLAAPLANHGSTQLASQSLGETFMKRMQDQQWMDKITAWMDRGFDPDAWSQFHMRWILVRFAAVATDILERSTTDQLGADPYLRQQVTMLQRWLDHMALRDEHPMRMYAMAADYYAALIGRARLIDMCDQTEFPRLANSDHGDRVGGMAQLQLDLPWIKVSVPFWTHSLMDQVDEDRDQLDRDLIRRLADGLEAAYQTSIDLGLHQPGHDDLRHEGRLIAALVFEDEDTVRTLLSDVVDRNDKRLRDDTAMWIGNCARFMSKAWFGRVLDLWTELVDYKPKYYWIAWRAALTGAPQRALMVAERAAERFSDDPAFVQEYQFMRKLLDDGGDGGE